MEKESNSITFDWLAIVGIGLARWQNLQTQWKTLGISESEAWREVVKGSADFALPAALVERVKKHNQRFGKQGWLEYLESKRIVPLYFKDERYPKKLKEVPQAPVVVYLSKNNQHWEAVCSKTVVAVVGTRHPTPSGEGNIQKILIEFLGVAAQQVVLASGMMYGIDEIAHKQAILMKSETLAVLGCGLDWQSAHDSRRAFHEIKEAGGVVLSQFHPEQSPQKGTFVARNTVLAGLADGVVVGEAHPGSGSRHTVAAAAKQHKPIWCIPVSLSHPTVPAVVEWVNKYNAKLLCTAEPLVKHFQLTSKFTKQSNLLSNEPQTGILKDISQGKNTFDTLAQATGLPLARLNEILLRLELTGTIERRGSEWLLVKK